MKRLILGIVCLVALGVQAQELNCTVTINSDKIEGSNKSVFETLKQTITEYMNNNRWTNMTFAESEKIECVFTYQEYDRIEYQQNVFTNNLTAMLAYYVYLIIGHDCDSYQRLGGTPYFQACEDIVSACQSASMEATEVKGWKAFDSNRNRYALINNLMDEAFKKYREYYYTYHRLGLDMMTANVANARATIADGLPVLREANRARPATYVINTFLDAKADELTNIFMKGTDKEKKSVYEILMDIDPTRNNLYEKIIESK